MIVEEYFNIVPEKIKDFIATDDWLSQYQILDFDIEPARVKPVIDGPGTIIIDFTDEPKPYNTPRNLEPVTNAYQISFNLFAAVTIWRSAKPEYQDVFAEVNKQIKSDIARLATLFRTKHFLVNEGNWFVDGLRIVNVSWGQAGVSRPNDVTAQLRTGVILLSGIIEVS